MKWLSLIIGALALFCAAICPSCNSKSRQTSSIDNKLTIKGSDTMVILNQRWSEEYMKLHPDVSIQVTGGGSGTGIAALRQGTTELAAASRSIKPKEKEEIEKIFHQQVFEIPVAIDALSIFVNTNNPIKNLTIEQIEGIYSGQITNWKELGWEDREIIAYSRENNSGTYDFFKDVLLHGNDFGDNISYLPGTAAIINALQEDKNGIGYGGIAYLPKSVSALGVKKDLYSKAVFPTNANTQSGEYPLARRLFYYSVGEPKELSQKFIEFALSPEGQKICEQVGYFSIAQENP